MQFFSKPNLVAALAVALSTTSLVQAEDAKTLQTKLESKYALTVINAEGGTVTQGAVLKLKKNLTGGTNKCSNDYKDGRVSLGGNVIQRTQCARLPGVPVSATSRGFVPGEQMSVVKIEVKDGIVFTLISDAVGDIRYHAELKFNVAKGTNVDMAMADQMIGDVFAVVPADDQQQGGGAQTSQQSAPPPAPAAPAAQQSAALPDIAPPPPPPDAPAAAGGPAPAAPAQTLSLGLTIDQVVGILGQPATVADLGAKKIYTYRNPTMKITFVDGKVTDMQ
jgi:hypothetical protein